MVITIMLTFGFTEEIFSHYDLILLKLKISFFDNIITLHTKYKICRLKYTRYTPINMVTNRLKDMVTD